MSITSTKPRAGPLVVLGALALGCSRAATGDSVEPKPEPDLQSAAEPVIYVEAAPDPRPAPTQDPPNPLEQPEPVGTEAQRALAKQLYAEGQKLFEQGNMAGALDRFERAYAYVRLPALKYNVAHCLERLGRVVAACDAYREIQEFPDDDLREAAAESRARLGC